MVKHLLKFVLVLTLLCGAHGVPFGGYSAEAEAHAATVQLPKTGQITSYAAGDDGAVQAGVAWPNPRFTDNGNGTVTDNLTGLFWLKNANCFGSQAWATAINSANNLASGACGLTDGSTAGQWRLPNITEIMSLIDSERYNPALPSGHPFSAVQASNGYTYYWSSSTSTVYTTYAFYVHMYAGLMGHENKTGGVYATPHNFYVWPVRAGQ